MSYDSDSIENYGRPPRKSSKCSANGDGHTFLKGVIVGFGLAAVASVAFNLFQEQRSRRRKAYSAESRFRSQDEAGGVMGDLSNIIDESSGAFKDAVQTLDRTFESGRQALDTFNDVISKIREQ